MFRLPLIFQPWSFAPRDRRRARLDQDRRVAPVEHAQPLAAVVHVRYARFEPGATSRHVPRWFSEIDR
jgi:hypothetical protein